MFHAREVSQSVAQSVIWLLRHAGSTTHDLLGTQPKI